jgi:CDP-2,3-bis-(O-geranylgeranyl)-sn-glycerol synthase
MDYLRLFELIYLMLPVYLANMVPPFVRFWRGWNPPISERYLGSHKTVIGFSAGVVMAIITTATQHLLAWERSLVDYDSWLTLGSACGLGAMAGDSIKSFFKRRRHVAPGERWIPADQLDFVAGGLLALSVWYKFSLIEIIAIVSISFVGDISVNHMAFHLGIRKTPW